MKKLIIITTMVLMCCFALANSAKAAGTTCTITLSAATGFGITYEVQFRIWDTYSPGWYTGLSNWASINVGTTYNFPIPLDVAPDSDNRWIVYAYVRQLQNGNPTGKTGSDTDGPMSSDYYYSGNITFSVTIL